MCGISGIFGRSWEMSQLNAMHHAQRHRGPDADGIYVDPESLCGLAHNRLSIIDLSPAGRQPLSTADRRFHIILNGEIYNYLELRKELETEYIFRTFTDTEVLIAAYLKWGIHCLDKLIGMFAFVIWDEQTKMAFAARDRFGVKPLFIHEGADKTIYVASEIKALHAAGVSREPDLKAWAQYLSTGITDLKERTFWTGINSLPAGHLLLWTTDGTKIVRWYDIAQKIGDEFDGRREEEVALEYLDLMKQSVEMRFRADVPVGINLSGGLDSSTLLSMVQITQSRHDTVKAFTFVTGDERYDELPWVKKMIDQTRHPLVIASLSAEEVPRLAASVQEYQDEPFGGLPTIAYAKLFEEARSNDVKVLLDGNGMDEQWGGYDYYQRIDSNGDQRFTVVQGTQCSPLRPECLDEEFRSIAERIEFAQAFSDGFRNLQYRDTVYTKIPRALRFNDRVSMRASTELREPFLDHRLVELAFRQPQERKRQNGTGKKMLRDIVRNLMPCGISEAPKRPLQTPQREWLRGPLSEWAEQCIKAGLEGLGNGWFKKDSVLSSWRSFCSGESDNSFYVWQWISVGLMSK